MLKGAVLLGLAAIVLFGVGYGVGADEVAQALTLVGAIAAAGLAALTAQWRLERQLAAERERLDASLRHDRDLARLAELRRVLDEATVAVRALERAILDVSDAYVVGGEAEAHGSKTQELGERSADVRVLVVRLRLRLGRRHVAVEALDALAGRGDAIVDAALRLADPASDPASDRIALNLQLARFDTEVESFLDRALETAGSLAERLGEEPLVLRC